MKCPECGSDATTRGYGHAEVEGNDDHLALSWWQECLVCGARWDWGASNARAMRPRWALVDKDRSEK